MTDRTQSRSVIIMGEKWGLQAHDPTEDELLGTRFAYTDESIRTIVISTEIKTAANDITNLTKRIIRHEVVHAFLFECGLSSNAHDTDCWADDEEIVDWIALTGEKIYKVWKELGVAE